MTDREKAFADCKKAWSEFWTVMLEPLKPWFDWLGRKLDKKQ